MRSICDDLQNFGGGRIAHVELHGFADLHPISHRNGAALRVGAEDASDEKVALPELGLVLVDDAPHMQAL